jgi:hypothetical protein
MDPTDPDPKHCMNVKSFERIYLEIPANDKLRSYVAICILRKELVRNTACCEFYRETTFLLKKIRKRISPRLPLLTTDY